MDQLDITDSVSNSPPLLNIERVYLLKFFLASNSRNHCSELTIYLDAELQVVESELLALQKVMVKLQSEMREALDTKG